MRVVSWNLARNTYPSDVTHDAAWRYLRDLDPDVALLQEARARLPDWVGATYEVARQPAQRWGSLILAKPKFQLLRWPGEQPRLQHSTDVYLATATIRILDDASVVVGSVHAPIGAASLTDLSGLDAKLIKRPRAPVAYRSDVAYAFYRELVRGRRFLISGDWNVARLWDYQYGHPQIHEIDFFDRAHADGWIECYRRLHPEGEGRTWFRGSEPPYQMDHAFCDEETAQTLQACEIDKWPAESLHLSDHAPLILEFAT